MMWILTYGLWEDIKDVLNLRRSFQKNENDSIYMDWVMSLTTVSLLYDCKQVKNNRFQIGENQLELKPC